MTPLISLFIFSSLFHSSFSVGIYADGSTFCYSDHIPGCPGPSHWGGECNLPSSHFQSPIDLPSSPTPSVTPRAIDLHLNSYRSKSFRILNTGHTILIQFPRSSNGQPPIALGRWEGFEHTEYKLDSMHFHWGPLDNLGSEHYLANRSYSMELHLVHYKSNFDSVQSAVNSNESNSTLAVIGIFLHASSESSEPNPELQPIIRHIPEVEQPSHGHWTEVNEPLDFRPFLSALPGQANVYNYKGSLTTPPCSQKVSWHVVDRPFTISHEDVAAFRTIYDEQGDLLTQNYRPLQPRDGREVYLVAARPA